MRGREVIGSIIEERGISYAELGRRLDVSRAAMWDRVNTSKSRDISSAILAQTLDAMGYTLAAVPKDAPLPEDSYIVN